MSDTKKTIKTVKDAAARIEALEKANEYMRKVLEEEREKSEFRFKLTKGVVARQIDRTKDSIQLLETEITRVDDDANIGDKMLAESISRLTERLRQCEKNQTYQQDTNNSHMDKINALREDVDRILSPPSVATPPLNPVPMDSDDPLPLWATEKTAKKNRGTQASGTVDIAGVVVYPNKGEFYLDGDMFIFPPIGYKILKAMDEHGFVLSSEPDRGKFSVASFGELCNAEEGSHEAFFSLYKKMLMTPPTYSLFFPDVVDYFTRSDVVQAVLELLDLGFDEDVLSIALSSRYLGTDFSYESMENYACYNNIVGCKSLSNIVKSIIIDAMNIAMDPHVKDPDYMDLDYDE